MRTVLVIEDDKVIRENIAEILTLSEYHVLAAKDGKEGVQIAVQHRPDLIICDIMMPSLDGYGVIHMLQKRDETRNIPFIFLTAKIEREDMRKGMQLGADDYITKPFTETDLLTTIETRLRKLDQLRKEFAPGIEGLNKLMAAVDDHTSLEALAENRETKRFKKKEIIYAAGSSPSKMYFIKRGKVKAYKTNEDGKELVTNLYSDNDFFGHIAMFESAAYKETTETLEDTEVAVIPRTDFEKLINNNAEVVRKFVKLLANDITEKEQQLLNMAYNSLRKRVADALVAITNKYGADKEGSIITMNRLSLANIAGTAKESVVRVLSDFKDEGLIDIIDKGDIVIRDLRKLRNILN